MATACICPTCHRELDPGSSIVVSLDTNTVTFRGNVVKLRPKETEILFVLSQASPNAVHIESIIAKVWAVLEPDASDRNVHVHMCRLRQRILPIGLKITNSGRRYLLSDWITPTLAAVRAAA